MMKLSLLAVALGGADGAVPSFRCGPPQPVTRCRTENDVSH